MLQKNCSLAQKHNQRSSLERESEIRISDLEMIFVLYFPKNNTIMDVMFEKFNRFFFTILKPIE